MHACTQTGTNTHTHAESALGTHWRQDYKDNLWAIHHWRFTINCHCINLSLSPSQILLTHREHSWGLFTNKSARIHLKHSKVIPVTELMLSIWDWLGQRSTIHQQTLNLTITCCICQCVTTENWLWWTILKITVWMKRQSNHINCLMCASFEIMDL